MNKDSDGQCEFTSFATIADWDRWLDAQEDERRFVVQFLRKFNGMEAVAARIEKGEHRDANWSK